MLIADGKVIIETGLDNFNTSHVNVNLMKVQQKIN